MKHLILDTSIFVRFLSHDVEDQYQDARQTFIDIEEGLVVGSVSILTIQELVWMLEYTYLIPREEFVPLLLTLFSLKNLKVIECKKALLTELLQAFKTKKIDFSRMYLLHIKGDKKIVSFDKSLQKVI